MSSILTAAGIALCTTLLGNSLPTYKDCQTAILRSQPPSDSFFKSPTLNERCPDSMKCEHERWSNCVAWATYDILDGSKGTAYFCWRNARLIWLPDGRWSWSLDNESDN
jgi:hypothetical protein